MSKIKYKKQNSNKDYKDNKDSSHKNNINILDKKKQILRDNNLHRNFNTFKKPKELPHKLNGKFIAKII